jgi:uncharacterized protein
MSKRSAFWDSSALVPLCLHQSTSRQARAQLRKFLPLVWWGSLVEVHRAIARLHRLGQLTEAEEQNALSQLDLLNRGWREILPGDPVRELATRFLDAHDLRAADSLQLAAAMTWCQQRPAKREFVGAGQRLSRVAIAAGFSVLELS